MNTYDLQCLLHTVTYGFSTFHAKRRSALHFTLFSDWNYFHRCCIWFHVGFRFSTQNIFFTNRVTEKVDLFFVKIRVNIKIIVNYKSIPSTHFIQFYSVNFFNNNFLIKTCFLLKTHTLHFHIIILLLL